MSKQALKKSGLEGKSSTQDIREAIRRPTQVILHRTQRARRLFDTQKEQLEPIVLLLIAASSWPKTN